MSSYNLTEDQKDIAKKNCIIEQHTIEDNWNPSNIFRQSTHIEQDKNINSDNIVIEIGSGNGNFLINLAETNPNKFYIGIEIRRKRVLQCAFKSYKRNLDNIKFIYADAKIVLISKKIQKQSVGEYYLTFPDPWSKNKHKQNRMINNDFIKTIHSSLVPEGKFTIATDNKNYMMETLDTIEYNGQFEYLLKDKVSNKLENFYQSYFEKLWREQGREIYYCIVSPIKSCNL